MHGTSQYRIWRVTPLVHSITLKQLVTPVSLYPMLRHGQLRSIPLLHHRPSCLIPTAIRIQRMKYSISFTPSNVEAQSVAFHANATPSSLLSHTKRNQKPGNEIFQSSFPETSSDIVPSNNGFTRTILDAYSYHRALIIRPDDVWLAILVQFSFFVNGNAELLRSQFVTHEGKKELEIKAQGTRYTVDFGHMARAMTDEIQKNVVDPSLRAWIMPEFSTTTTNDTTVCSIVMMATLKEYFSYKCSLSCGIPRVTLEGEKKDWENILERLEKLKDYGVQSIAWYHLLVPILSRFVKAFDEPNGNENVDFWQRVAHYHGGGSGPTWLSGWITAFCVFDAKGRWLGGRFREVRTIVILLNHDKALTGNIQEPKTAGLNPASLSSAEFLDTYMIRHQRPFMSIDESLVLDNMPYHRIDTNDIPPGYAEVDVKLDDNGEKIDCILTAGLVGSMVRDSKDMDWNLRGSGIRDVVSPLAGWWMSKKPSPADQRGNGGSSHGPYWMV